MNIYVGNLNFQTTEGELRPLFEEFGQVKSVKMIMDRETGRPKGFAFVEMSNAEQGQQAIEGLNGATISGRPVVVNEARPRAEGDRSGSRPNNRPSYGGGNGYQPRDNQNSGYGGPRDNQRY